MKKLLILVDKIGPSVETLAQVVGNNLGPDTRLVLRRFSDLVFEIGEGERCNVWVDVADIRDFNLVYFRRVGHDFSSMAGTLALCLDKLGIRYFDTKFREIGAAGDKFTALTRLTIGGISVPRSMFLWNSQIAENATAILDKLGSPVIAKDYAAQRNSQIFILKKESDFKALESVRVKDREGQFLFQEFIELESEYRLLVLKDHVAVVHTKAVRDYSGHQVVDNTPEDNLTFIDPKEIATDLKEVAIAAAKTLGVEIAGVDVARQKKTGKVYVLEVNRGPGLMHDPKKSPELGQLAKFFAAELKRSNG